MKRRPIAIVTLIGLVVSAGTYFAHAHDMRIIRHRLLAGSQLSQTRFGAMEYATWGNGPAVLVVHGAGGGYDQGILMVRAFGGEGFRWVVPSRFGYLRTPMPADASTAAQADAFAGLLDALGKVARRSLEPIFDVTPALQGKLTPQEQVFVDDIVNAFQPVTARTAGLRNEGAAINPEARYSVEEIRRPTLVVHSKDDHINPFAFGEYTAQHIPGAQFMPLETGGHLLLGHHSEVRARVTAFLREHASAAK